MYKLLNFLFGWDYLVWSFGGGFSKGVSRVRTLPDGRHYFLTHGFIGQIEFLGNDKYEVIAFLTCKPEKYL